MQVSPRPLDRVLDGYRMQQRALSVEQLTELAAQLHIAHLAELRRLRDYRRRLDDVQPYRPQHTDHLLRVNNRLEEGVAPAPWRPVVLPRNLQELFDTVPKTPQVKTADSAGVWRATRGWAAGALLLLAALFLLRATDRFFTRNYLRWRRSRSEEWPTPNVLATSQVETPPVEVDSPSEAVDADLPDDLPPPYSECSRKHRFEEPPPPYSACYVEFTNPKDGIPAVHFYNSRRQNIFRDLDAGTSSSDTGQREASRSDERQSEARAESPKVFSDAC
ncbi:unnamed protein product [Pieris macdunnoughi]|uniref:Uncharacterized protein n=1 Tax=Pieris macdunnoughi TaxID=345717 RepID=A0A821YBX4_9NEOP|nr:unnamed protein product [Pieris macdunnoughi]